MTCTRVPLLDYSTWTRTSSTYRVVWFTRLNSVVTLLKACVGTGQILWTFTTSEGHPVEMLSGPENLDDIVFMPAAGMLSEYLS